MKFCQPHWDALREAIADRGLEVLVAENGDEALTKMRRQLEGEDTIDSFEPLLHAHGLIMGNTLNILGPNGLYLMQPESVPEDEVSIADYGPQAAGRTWPRCPLCYLSLAHELSCDGCDLPREDGYAWMIDRAADDTLAKWQELGK